LLRALKTLPKKNNLKLVMTLSIVLSALYGISDEIHQHYVPSRNADVIDAMADIIGSIFGVYIYQSIWTKRFLRPRRKWPKPLSPFILVRCTNLNLIWQVKRVRWTSLNNSIYKDTYRNNCETLILHTGSLQYLQLSSVPFVTCVQYSSVLPNILGVRTYSRYALFKI
jgi:hypothetical protein